MKILVVNSSPYGRRGITATILTPFLEGVREAGGHFEVIVVNKLKISPCRGCLTCWFKQKNVCTQQDDMAGLITKFSAADAVVFSTPVYCDGVPGQLKIMMDRLVAIGNPFLEIRDGHTRHPAPPGEKPKKFVLISSCGLWESDNFNPMIMHLKAFCRNLGITFSGSLLRPHSFALKNHQVNDILRAAKSAGHELIETGAISDASQAAVRREIVPRETYIGLINKKAEFFTRL